MNPLSITSDEPGISVRAPATRPPVQDSAVAMVSLRIRQRSSSERERARASLPLISVAPALVVPGEADGGAGYCRDALLAAGESKAFAGGCFHGYPRQRKAGDLGDARAHGVPVRADLRPFADQRHIEVSNSPAARADPIDRVSQEFIGCRAVPLWIAWRKMRADIAVCQRAQDCIYQRVKSDVPVRMREKTTAVRHADAADHQVIAFGKSVNVVAAAGSNVAKRRAKAGFFADKIFWSSQVHVRRIAFKGRHRQSRSFGQRRVISEIATALAFSAAMGFEDDVKPECLGCLSDPQSRALRRGFDVSGFSDQLDGVRNRDCGNRRAGTAGCIDRARNQG